MKKKFKYGLAGLLTTAVIAGTGLSAIAADSVEVYADAEYSDTHLVVNIYANIDTTIDTDPLVSGGVKLTYNAAGLINPVAEKNETVWYFGDGTTNHTYVDPDTSTAGEVVVFLGRINSTETTQSGVSGSDVLLATVTLERSPAGGTVTDPAATFGVDVDLARDRVTYVDYVNFASLAGVDWDASVTFLPTSYLCELVGDLNKDGSVNIFDFGIFRANYASGDLICDLNGDGFVNVFDFGLFRANYGTSCP